MKQFSRIYLEITNQCNCTCSFCIGNSRPSKFLSVAEMAHILPQIKPYTDYLYFHVLGEPLLHPQLGKFLEMAGTEGFQVNLTTNGTLLEKQRDMLLSSPALRKVSISLHSLEGESVDTQMDYLNQVADFAQRASAKGVLCELRFWNLGGSEGGNVPIFSYLCGKLSLSEDRVVQATAALEAKGNFTLAKGLFLSVAQRFEWPAMTAPLHNQPIFCYGLRSQVAILSDGTVVPCCLDSSGDVALGNLFTSTFQEAIQSPRARTLYDGFSNRTPTEELCKRCGYATKFV